MAYVRSREMVVMPPQVLLGWIRTDQLPGLSAGEGG